MRQEDCINVEVLISNESELELRNASLEVWGPAFFKWYDGRCEPEEKNQAFGGPSPATLALGSIAAQSPFKRQIHLRTASSIDVGEYNVLFRTSYEWQAAKQPAHSFVSAEKPVKVNFLGNESVAGIPLALAGFIIPGFFFWLIVKKFGAAWSIDGLSDQMIYSIMFSILLVVVGYWFGFWDVSAGVSIGKVTTLAAVGAGLGIIAGGVDLGVRSIRKRRRAERQITDHEDEFSLLGKLLELPSSNRLERPIITINNEVYSGSLGSRTNVPAPNGAPGPEVVYLIGSYKMRWDLITEQKLREHLQSLLADKKMREFVRLANEKAALEVVEQVQLNDNAGADNPIADPFKQWTGDTTKDLSIRTGSNTWTSPTLDTN